MGQIDYLAATDDGAQIYFSTPLRMRGSDQYLHSKILRIAGGRLELFAQEARGPGGPAEDPRLSNFHLFYQPVVSGDGRVVAYSMMRTCTPFSSGCAFLHRFAGRIVRPAKADITLPGTVFVNKSGRYAVIAVQIAGSSILGRLDLETGEQFNLPISAQPLINEQTITDDGKVVFFDIESGLTLWSPTATARIHTDAPVFRNAILNRYGTHLVYVEHVLNPDSMTLRLRLRELASGRERLLLDDSGDVQQLAVSNDGRLTLLLTTPSQNAASRLFLVNSDGARVSTPLIPDGVRRAVLTGDGSRILAATESNRLVSVDIRSGVVTELLARSPALLGHTGAPVPGSLQWITGMGLSDASKTYTPPLPTEGPGVQIRISGQPMPLVAVSPTRIAFQIPFGTVLGSHEIDVMVANAPFEGQGLPLNITTYSPQFVKYESASFEIGPLGSPRAFHADFSGPVTMTNPARRGDIITAYMTGLGVTLPPVETGMPGPFGPPATAPLSCTTGVAGEEPVEVLFSGMAPGLIGVYQVNLRLPVTSQNVVVLNPLLGVVNIRCADTAASRDSLTLSVFLNLNN